MVLNIFSCAYYSLVYHFWRNIDSCPLLTFSSGCSLFLLSCRSSLFSLDVNPLSGVICKYFLPFHRLPFHFVDCVSWHRNHCQIQCHEAFSLYRQFFFPTQVFLILDNVVVNDFMDLAFFLLLALFYFTCRKTSEMLNQFRLLKARI